MGKYSTIPRRKIQVADWNTGLPLASLCVLQLLKGFYPWVIWDQILEQQTNCPAPTRACALWTKGFFCSLPDSSREQLMLCHGVGCSPQQGPTSSSPTVMVSPAMAQPPLCWQHLPIGYRSCQPHPPATGGSINKIFPILYCSEALEQLLQVTFTEASVPSHTGSLQVLLSCSAITATLAQFDPLDFPRSGCCLCELLWVLRHC